MPDSLFLCAGPSIAGLKKHPWSARRFLLLVLLATMSSIQETVAVLEAFELEDEQPNIEGASFAITFDSSVNTNFNDRAAFETKWAEETVAMAKFVSFCGAEDHNMIYISACTPRLVGLILLSRERVLRCIASL